MFSGRHIRSSAYPVFRKACACGEGDTSVETSVVSVRIRIGGGGQEAAGSGCPWVEEVGRGEDTCTNRDSQHNTHTSQELNSSVKYGQYPSTYSKMVHHVPHKIEDRARG
ncbi:hypothetical protein E2C01_094915 [Portunus trituberculatus]|uniref:Uncharacterized protein n=1 Tax=Portunus trituberculatus TaxID=210409 RepID=A0A5B7K2Y4_PORTR|nr:hypothetical protein [Portunus trituberculatus]